MTRAEAEALVSLCDREWFRGADESVRRRRVHRTAVVLDLWEGERGFDGETMSLLDQPELGGPQQEQLEEPSSSLPQESARRRTRRGDPETSLKAAASIDELRDRQRAVRSILATSNAGLTDEELVRQYQAASRRDRDDYPEQAESGIRTRRHELVELGFVEDAGITRQISTGRQATVWRITHKR